jgi:hypothetical protein
MERQNYANHSRYVKGYHFLLSLLLFAGLLISSVNLARHWNVKGFVSAAMIVLLFICAFLMAWYLRAFPVKVQDRAIRAEESLRYYILSGKAIDSRLTMAQIVALRFAPDEEFLALAEKAAGENLSPKDIKKAIKNWKADHYRA